MPQCTLEGCHGFIIDDEQGGWCCNECATVYDEASLTSIANSNVSITPNLTTSANNGEDQDIQTCIHEVEESDNGMKCCRLCSAVLYEPDQTTHDLSQNEGQSRASSIGFGPPGVPKIMRDAAHRKWRLEHRRHSVGFKLCQHSMDHLLNSLKFTEEMKEKARELLAIVLKNDAFYKCHNRNKNILTGVCAYYVAKEMGASISFKDVAKNIGCTFQELQKFYAKLKREEARRREERNLPGFLSKEPQDEPVTLSARIDKLIPRMVAACKFSPSEELEMERRTKSLVTIFYDNSFEDQKSPEFVIWAALFASWKSFNRERYDFTLPQFVREFGLQKSINNTVKKRFKRLEEILVDMVNELPFNVQADRKKPRTIYPHMSDIIKFKRSLTDKTAGKRTVRSRKSPPLDPLQERIREDPFYDISLPNRNSEEIGEDEFADSEIEENFRTEREIEVLKRFSVHTEETKNEEEPSTSQMAVNS